LKATEDGKGTNTMITNEEFGQTAQRGHTRPEAASAFWAYDKAALAEGAIPKKYKELMAIAVALTPSVPTASKSTGKGP
jgi:alkylhydroperoxidase/carboxymuconolactone decarboxylase family protein YurZ